MKANSKFKKRITPYIFIFPCFLLMAVILLYPLIKGIFSSFMNENLLTPGPSKFIGIENYIRLFTDPMFQNALLKSLICTFSVLAGQLIFGFLIAVLLNRDIKGKKIFRCIVLIPWIIPNAIAGIAWKWILNEQNGILNLMLLKMGLIKSYQPWLADNKLAFLSLIIVATWKGIPFVTIVLLSGLQSINHSLYESAQVDGAGSTRVFFQITMPLVKGILMTVGILEAIWNFNQFDIIQVMTRGGPGEATLLMPVFTYRLFLDTFQVSYASSASTMMLVIMLVPMYFYVKKLMLESD